MPIIVCNVAKLQAFLPSYNSFILGYPTKVDYAGSISTIPNGDNVFDGSVSSSRFSRRNAAGTAAGHIVNFLTTMVNHYENNKHGEIFSF